MFLYISIAKHIVKINLSTYIYSSVRQTIGNISYKRKLFYVSMETKQHNNINLDNKEIIYKCKEAKFLFCFLKIIIKITYPTA